MINAFIGNTETFRIQNRFAVKHHRVFQAAAFNQADRLQIVHLIFFAKRTAGSDFSGKDTPVYFAVKNLMPDNSGRKFYFKTN